MVGGFVGGTSLPNTAAQLSARGDWRYPQRPGEANDGREWECEH